MDSFTHLLKGMELNEAESLLKSQSVVYTVNYTETRKKKDIYINREKKHRIIRVKDRSEGLELTVCVI